MAKKKIEKEAVIDNVIEITVRSYEQNRYALKRKVRMLYDIQRLRLQCEGRTHHKKPEDTGANKIDLHPDDVLILEARTNELELAEGNALKDVASHLRTIPFYKDVLSKDKKYLGIGPAMAGVMLAEFNIHKAEMVSQMWSYAGLAPLPAVRCKACSQLCLPEMNENEDGEDIATGNYIHKYASKDCPKIIPEAGIFQSGRAARPETGKKLAYNAFLRSKLCGVLGGIFLTMTTYHCPECTARLFKSKDLEEKKNDIIRHKGDNVDCTRFEEAFTHDMSIRKVPYYVKYYDDYKNRKTNDNWGTSPVHRHKASIRYMIKMMLIDLYVDWRTYEKLSVRKPYAEEYLGHVHHTDNKSNEITPSSKDNEDRYAAEIATVMAYDEEVA